MSSRIRWVGPASAVLAALAVANPAFGASANLFSDGTKIVPLHNIDTVNADCENVIP